MMVNCVVISLQVAAMGNAHLGLAATKTRNLPREICQISKVSKSFIGNPEIISTMAGIQVGQSQGDLCLILVIENVYGTQVKDSF